MNDESKKDIDRFDRISRLAAPIIGALLIGLTAFLGDRILSSHTSRQENARLITQLQIQREQAEIALRKDVFDQAMTALLDPADISAASGLSLSKRMLKLELLAHNFGGSLNLSPIFAEFDRDLEQLECAAENNLDQRVTIKDLRNRLRGLAQRLGSKQLSELAQHGILFEISVPLEPDGRSYPNDRIAYQWPEDKVTELVLSPEEWPSEDEYNAAYDAQLQRLALKQHDGNHYFVAVGLEDLNAVTESVRVSFNVCPDPDPNVALDGCPEPDDGVRRTFELDSFNFPKIDNTRLPDNQRFAIVLENFSVHDDSPLLQLAAVVFPAEYASLREPPSMEEAVNILHSVLQSQEDKEEKQDE